jgi:gamma-glutamylcyclotransferase
MPFRCFAYGSNMFTTKMQVPAPSATFVTTGRIAGYLFRFNKESNDGSGKGNIVATGSTTDVVWGVVFKVADGERNRLDRSEGGYDPTTIEIVTPIGPLAVVTYIAKPNRVNNALRPYAWYKDFAVRGAEDHGLPPEYIAEIVAIPTMADPDAARETGQRALLNAGGVPKKERL